MAGLTKTQLDRLGERIRKEEISDRDLTLLDEYRRSFSPAFEQVVRKVREALDIEVAGRPAKSTPSIRDKLLRESIRFTQIQDIAGCRIVVADISEQDRTVEIIEDLFNDTVVVDRRKKPSNGYRAVHVLVKLEGKTVELQVRTVLQHLWAEFSEKLSDSFGTEIKYGKGNDEVRSLLSATSGVVASAERLDLAFERKKQEITGARYDGPEFEGFDKLEFEIQRLRETATLLFHKLVEANQRLFRADRRLK